MGILQALFGGSKSKATSDNRAFDQLQGALTPAIGGVNRLNDTVGSFEDSKKNAGFDFSLGRGLDAITGGAAAKGLLRSGPTGKAFTQFGNDLSSQFYNNYLDRVGQVSQLGLGAAGALAGAGARSQSKGSSSNGILNTLFG